MLAAASAAAGSALHDRLCAPRSRRPAPQITGAGAEMSAPIECDDSAHTQNKIMFMF
jgi:hypothetical protein